MKITITWIWRLLYSTYFIFKLRHLLVTNLWVHSSISQHAVASSTVVHLFGNFWHSLRGPCRYSDHTLGTDVSNHLTTKATKVACNVAHKRGATSKLTLEDCPDQRAWLVSLTELPHCLSLNLTQRSSHSCQKCISNLTVNYGRCCQKMSRGKWRWLTKSCI